MPDDIFMWSEGLELNEEDKFRLDLYEHFPLDFHLYDYEICAQYVHIVQKSNEKDGKCKYGKYKYGKYKHQLQMTKS